MQHGFTPVCVDNRDTCGRDGDQKCFFHLVPVVVMVMVVAMMNANA